MKKKLPIIFAVFISFTSCAKGVKHIEKNKKEEKISFTDAKFEYATLDKVSESYSDALDSNYKHFSINSNVTINGIKSVSVLSFTQKNDSFFDIEQDLLDYLNGEKLDTGKKIEEKDSIGTCHMMNADEGYPYFCDYEGGSIVWIKDEYSESFFLPDDNVTSERYFYVNSLDDQKYQLKDCEMSINEAIEICNDFSSNLTKYGYPELFPQEIYVERQNDTYAFYIEMSQNYDGIPLRSLHCGFDGGSSSSDVIYTGKLKKSNTNPAGYSILIDSSKGVSCFRNNENVYEIYEKEKIDKIITPHAALEYIDNNLSENSSYEVEYISLENKMYYLDSKKNIFYSLPMWTVSLYSPEEDKKYYALIDCVTGDFSFYGQ